MKSSLIAERIVGHSGIKVNTLPPKEFLDECFEYFPDTGELKWRKRPLSHFSAGKKWSAVASMNRWNALYAGKEAGFRGKDGRGSVSLSHEGFNGSVLVTRLIFAIQGVDVPDGMVIDHINRIRSDDRWINLRVITQGENRANSNSPSKTVHHNLPRCVSPNGKDKWAARINHKCKVIHLGTYNSPEEAHAAYVAKAIELRGEFAVTE